MRARRTSEAGSFEGSAIWNRRIPFRTASRNDSRITSSPAGTHEMKRMPVVIRLSGPPGDKGVPGVDKLERGAGRGAPDEPQPLPRVLAVEAHRDRHVGA